MSEKEASFPSFRRASIKPLLQPTPRSSLTPGKKGWKFLRSLNRKGKLLTSLTKAEERFLSSLKEEKDGGETPKEECKEKGAARLRLRDSILSKTAKLTPIEVTFLNSIVNSPSVETEYLDNCTQVLEQDPLYLDEPSVTKEEEDEKKQTKPDGRQSILSDASFRMELWKALQAEEDADSQQTLTVRSVRHLENVKDDDEAEQKIDQKEEKKTPQQQNAWEAFAHNFQMMFSKDEDKKEEFDEGTIGEEDDEVPATFRVLASSVEDLTENPLVLSPPIMDALRAHLPFAVQHDNYWLKYSLVRDGAYMPTLMDKVRSSARTILAIETDKGEVFGSFTSSPWRPYGVGYYGSGEAFLWRLRKSRFTPCATVKEQIDLENDVEVFPWSGQNRNVQSTIRSDSDMTIGGGGPDDSPEDTRGCGVGLAVTRDLERGFSDKCLTFESPPLMTRDKDIFRIVNLEMWTLTPCDSLDMAERLELGRQFVFDHGNFVE